MATSMEPIFWRGNETIGAPALAASTDIACIDISIDGLSETVEENPGAIVWRNSDFSKQSPHAVQTEATLTRYVPDYMAPSNVYDPEATDDFTTATVTIDSSMTNNYKVRFTFDDTKLELWTNSIWGGLEAAAGRSKIRPGVLLTTPTSSITFQIEGINASTAFATDFIQVEAIPNDGGATLEDKGFYTVVDTGIGVDGNRDTQIDFTNSYDRQLLFWLNNDQEGLHEVDTMIEAEQPNITSPGNADGVIGQRRDLEDLAPLRLNVDPLLVNNTFDTAGSGSPAAGQLQTTYRLVLQGAGGASIRLFNARADGVDAIEYLNNDFIAGVQAEQGLNPFWSVAIGPRLVTDQTLSDIDGGLNAFLFEAIGGAYGSGFSANPTLIFQTIVRYTNGQSTIKNQEIDLDLRDIKQFYTRWDINYGVNGGVNGTDLRTDLSFKDYPTPTTATQTSQVQNEAFFSGNDTTVLVHGWNNSDDPNNDDKAATAETMFKRLYWQGYRGEFVSFNWPTYLSTGNPATDTYNPSEFQAYRSAKALKEVLAGYRGTVPNLQPVHLLAHSMGNIVAGESLRLWTFDTPFNDDPLVTNYVAMNAAVSSGAYGSNDRLSLLSVTFPGRPIPDLYRFWSHGRDGFSDSGLGLAYYFQSSFFAAENTVNMYNANDFVLGLWGGNNLVKDQYVQSSVWPYDYDFVAGDGENTNNDDFQRSQPTPSVSLTLTDSFGRPGRDAYEIMAFFSLSASIPVGTQPLSRFDTNIDLQDFGLLGGNTRQANHSYQFNHDGAETWDFYETLKTQLEFASTQNAAASIGASVAATGERRKPEQTAAQFRQSVALDAGISSSLLRPAKQDKYALRSNSIARTVVFEQLGRPDRVKHLDRLRTTDAFYSVKEPTKLAFFLPHKNDESDHEFNDLFFDAFQYDISLFSPWQS